MPSQIDNWKISKTVIWTVARCAHQDIQHQSGTVVSCPNTTSFIILIDTHGISFNIPSASGYWHQPGILAAKWVTEFLCFFGFSVQFVSISLHLPCLQATNIHPQCELQTFLLIQERVLRNKGTQVICLSSRTNSRILLKYQIFGLNFFVSTRFSFGIKLNIHL